MEFRLPEELQKHLFVHTTPRAKQVDPAVETQSKKQKFPLGRVHSLIPEKYVTAEELDAAVVHINSVVRNARHHLFVDDLHQTKAILYHYQHCWVAAWHADDDEDYLYGVSICFRNTDNTHRSSKVDLHRLFNQITHYTHGEFKFPFGYELSTIRVLRTEYIIATRKVKLEDIKAIQYRPTECPESEQIWYPLLGAVRPSFRVMPSDYLKHFFLGYSYVIESSGYNSIRSCYQSVVNKFEHGFRSRVRPLDGSPVFERFCTPNPLPFVFRSGILQQQLVDDSNYLYQDNLDINFNLIYDLYLNSPNRFHQELLAQVGHIIKTPFFTKQINTLCSEINILWNSTDNTPLNQGDFESRGYRISSIIRSTSTILTIWPDCPIDYLQQHLESLLNSDILNLANSKVTEESKSALHWLRKTMPVRSFFNMLSKVEAKTTDSTAYRNPVRDFFRQFNDCINMIQTCLDGGVDLDPPSRWRMDEFHDHVMAQSWKVSNPNTILPQFLLPEPIQVLNGDDKWSFFQPKDTHQLAEWGRAVRNCVGNSHYAEGIKKNRHFIVLAMLNNKPTFTVQLSKRDSSCASLAVNQIKAISNQGLSSMQEVAYTQVFQQCLNMRALQLAEISSLAAA